MNIIIIGVGKVGETLLQNFIRESHDVTIVDKDYKLVERLVNLYDVRGIVGSGLERDILEDASILEADVMLACTNRDELNILACVLAKKLGANYVIARVRDPECFNEIENLKDSLGLDLVFNPERRTAMEIADVLKFPSARNVESFASGKGIMAEFYVDKKSILNDMSIIDISKSMPSKVLFGLVVRDGKTFIPHGDYIFRAGDYVHLIGDEKGVSLFFKWIKIYKSRAKSVMLLGGGKVGFYLAQELIGNGVDVKIIESDQNRCQDLAQQLPKATVICGDGTDQDLLKEEGISNCDAFVALTGLDESNAMISLYANSLGVHKVITKVNGLSILNMAKGLGLETIVSPRIAIANHILKFIRTHKTDKVGVINTYYKLNDKAEALEFLIDDKFKYLNIPLKTLSMRKESLIGGIVRGEDFILPSGDTTIQEGDKVIIVTGVKQITQLEQIFK